MPAAASQGTVSAAASSFFPAKSGPKTVGPRIAPNTDPKSTYEMPRARRAGGHMSPAAARVSNEIPLEAPTNTKPGSRAAVEPVLVASAVSRQPQEPSAKPTVSTGTRPKRSISRPAGTAVSPEEGRKIAGPRPSRPLTPVTSTNVSDETAAVSWRTAEFTAIVAARITVLRLIGRPGGTSVATGVIQSAAPERLLLQWRRGRTRQGRRARGDARAGSRHRFRLTFGPGCLRRLSADSRPDRRDPLPA